MSMEEVADLIHNMKNAKHQTLLMLMYSTGMRISEVSNLKIVDIDSKQMRIKVVDGKGKKDRYVPLSEILIRGLRAYIEVECPQEYLYNGKPLC